MSTSYHKALLTQRAFLLVEVLLTVSIISIAFVTLMTIIGRSIKSTSRALSLLTMQQLAENTLFELKTQKILTGGETTKTQADEQGNQYRIRTTLALQQLHEQPLIELYEAHISIARNNQQGETLTVNTIFLHPIKQDENIS